MCSSSCHERAQAQNIYSANLLAHSSELNCNLYISSVLQLGQLLSVQLAERAFWIRCIVYCCILWSEMQPSSQKWAAQCTELAACLEVCAENMQFDADSGEKMQKIHL